METFDANRRRLIGVASALIAGSRLVASPPAAAAEIIEGGQIPASFADSISVLEFGADATGQRDSLAAITRARDAAVQSGKELVFPPGVYRIDATLQLGYPRLHVRGIGRVVIQAGFDGGSIVAIDGGPANIIYQSSFRNFVIRGNGSAVQTGLFVRNAVHGHRADIRVRNVTRYAFHIQSDVFSVYDRLVSDFQNEGAGTETRPTHDLFVDETEAFGGTTACAFNHCILEEGTSFGAYLNHADNCIFKGGGAEGLRDWGVYVSAKSTRNRFEQFYCEQNALGDFDIYGARNQFIACEAYDGHRTTTQFKIRPGASGNVVEQCGAFSADGVALTTIAIDEGASDTVIRDCDLHRLIDNGLRTILDNYSDAYNGVVRSGGRTFGNTPNANPLALDWYEEGTFSPRFGGTEGDGRVFHDIPVGEFQRIGNRVTFTLALRISEIVSAPRGHLLIKGLPYPAAAFPYMQTVSVGDFQGFVLPAGATQIAAGVDGEAIRIVGLAVQAKGTPLNASTLSRGAMVAISGHYRVAS